LPSDARDARGVHPRVARALTSYTHGPIGSAANYRDFTHSTSQVIRDRQETPAGGRVLIKPFT
jgi:hypothetical protein